MQAEIIHVQVSTVLCFANVHCAENTQNTHGGAGEGIIMVWELFLSPH